MKLDYLRKNYDLVFIFSNDVAVYSYCYVTEYLQYVNWKPKQNQKNLYLTVGEDY